MLKSKVALKKMNPESTDVYVKSKFEYYSERPDDLENISLAEFVADYVLKKRNKTKNCEPDNDEIKSIVSDDDYHDSFHDIQDSHNNHEYRKVKRKIIRYRDYKIEDDPLNFYRSNLLLFFKWRNEFQEIENIDCKKKYLENEEQITLIRNSFIKIIISSAQLDEEIANIEKDSLNHNKTNETDFDGFHDEVLFDATEVPAQGEVGNFFEVKKMDEFEYFNLMRELNYKQKQYCNYICRNFKYNKVPIFNYVAGAGGVGKTRLIKAIFHSLERIFKRKIGIDISELFILLTAPTGKAAYNIKGSTIHSAFGLPITQCGELWHALSPDVVNKLRTSLRRLKVIIIDEVSMVGAKVFNQIDRHLRQIFKNNLPFGGISVLVFGDFIQLRPVGDNYIFQIDKSNNYSELTGSFLWGLFKYYKLTEIMRQKGDIEFAKALNGIGYGNMTCDQINMLQSRCFASVSDDIIKKSISLFYKNDDCDKMNEKILNGLKDGIINTAVDTVLGCIIFKSIL